MAKEKRTLDEQIAELQEKQRQLKEQEKKLRAQQTQAKRKERTKQQIEIGKAIYSVLGREYQEEDKERLVAFLKGTGDDFLIAMGRKQAPVEEVATSSNFSEDTDAEEQPKPKKRGRKPKAKTESK